MAREQFPLEAPLDFLQHLWQLNHALERRSQYMEKALGVTAQQRLFLRCIGKFPGMTASQLAAVLHLDRGTVSVALGRLVDKGLVAGEREKEDRRRVALKLTAKGAKLTSADPTTVEHTVKRLLDKVGPKAANVVRDVLGQLADELVDGIE